MITIGWFAAFWVVLSVVVGVWVGLVLRARDRQVPSGPRVRVEQRRGQR